MVGAFRIFRLCVDRQIDRSMLCMGLPQWLSSKESACNSGNSGDVGLIPGSGRSLGGGHGNSLQYFDLENLMDKGASGYRLPVTWQVTVHRVVKSQTRLK